MIGDPLQEASRLAQAGQFAEAARLCERVLAIRPTAAPALALAGLIALRLGDTAGALRRLQLAASVEPRNPRHQFNLGEALSAAQRFAEARDAYKRAIALNAKPAPFHASLGFALRALGDKDGAIAAFTRAATLDRNGAEHQVNLGAALNEAGRSGEAVATLRRAVALAPRAAEAQYNLGVALAAQGDRDGAEAAYQATLALAPNHAKALSNLGLIYEKRGEPARALPLHERACTLAPDMAEAWHNRGVALKELGRFAEAITAFDRALSLRPDNRPAQKNRALCRLTLADFAEGWHDYRARDVPRLPADEPAAPLPRDLSGRRILLVREQGVGDELFFLRFAPELTRRGAAVSAIVETRIAAMVARSGAATVVGDDAVGFDHRLHIGDLPLLLGHSSPEDCPPPLTIAPLDASLAKMRDRLAAAGPAPYIAVSWRAGTPTNMRNVPPGAAGRALAAARGTIIIAQRRPLPSEIEDFAQGLGRTATDLSDVNEDLEDMLALMALVDTYVAVSNTNVHLRASTGRATHALVAHPPEWRWLASGLHTPWFADATLYRQDASGDWNAALARLARELGGKS